MIQYKTILVIDDKGRLTIPIKVREAEGLERGSAVTLEYRTDGQIIIEKKGE